MVHSGIEAERRVPLAQTLADALYWLVFLLFLPAVLSALAMEGLLRPVQGMVDEILRFLPNLFPAGLILAAGWLVARIIQRIVSSLLAAIGADRLSEQVGLAPVLGEQRLSGLIGLVAYVLVFIPVLIAAFNALALAARVAILVLAGAMALQRMGLANEIINLAFGLLLGAIAVALALAFGLGGREIAARELEEWLDSVRSRRITKD